jgi:hypothetical protein
MLNLGPFRAKCKALDTLQGAVLLFRYRVRVNLARDVQRSMPKQRLHRTERRTYGIGHRRMTVP